jgi:hypothetical protein
MPSTLPSSSQFPLEAWRIKPYSLDKVNMNLNVIQKDKTGTISEKQYQVGLARLLKHIGIAGQNKPLSAFSILRGFGFLAYFYHYIDHPQLLWMPFRFRRNSSSLWDPTEIGQFANIIGKAVADMLARRISGALFTHAYEAALLVKNRTLSGKRPDLYCDTGHKQFALEAKGFTRSNVSDTKMQDFKKQAASGSLPVHFYVACATYALFDYPIITKYYDPENDNVEYDLHASLILARSFYSSVLGSLSELPEVDSRKLSNTDCSSFSLDRFGLVDCRVMIAKEAVKWTLSEKIPSKLPSFEKYEEDDIFLDEDGIGIEIG